MALKARQLNYRGFTRNIMSCPTTSGVTSQPSSQEYPTPRIQLEEPKAEGVPLEFQPNIWAVSSDLC